MSQSLLEPVIFKWKQFDGLDFLFGRGEHRSAIGKSGEDVDTAGTQKTSEPK